jgi:hypothetical protein
VESYYKRNFSIQKGKFTTENNENRITRGGVAFSYPVIIKSMTHICNFSFFFSLFDRGELVKNFGAGSITSVLTVVSFIIAEKARVRGEEVSEKVSVF